MLRRQYNERISQLASNAPLYRIKTKITNQLNEVAKVKFPETSTIDFASTAATYKMSFDSIVRYDDTAHVYFLQNEQSKRIPLISVTTLLHAFTKEFQEVEMSVLCAQKVGYVAENLDKPPDWKYLPVDSRAQLIRKAWRITNKNSTDFGTFAHACMEDLVRNPRKNTMDIFMEMSARYNQEDDVVLSFMDEMMEKYFPLLFEKNIHVFPEPVLYDRDIMVAGQSDLVIVDMNTGTIHIMDYKTNKDKPGSVADKAYNTLQGNLGHLAQTNLTLYQLQVCLYQAFLVKQHGYRFGTNTLLWLNRETGKIEPIEVDPKKHYDDIVKIYDFLGNHIDQLFVS